ncbi:hypothetical protein EXU48_12075 [Occultella glacieicola]|uniref:DUF3592 domain-containing protein n=1 Tax=Occultella glacieicola TaxID=2518684 RepID=A0ABY2E4Z0_9MICO|nr:hypothetical protein [Occultella glacieicola]TDE94170.1 hypothetical protein EXU48_12075 [Occultella glacieicola]
MDAEVRGLPRARRISGWLFVGSLAAVLVMPVVVVAVGALLGAVPGMGDRTPSWWPWDWLGLWLPAGLGASVVLCLIGMRAHGRAGRAIWLRYGRHAPAEVTGARLEDDDDGPDLLIVTVTVRPPGLAPYEADLFEVPHRLGAWPFAMGARVRVAYLPDHPWAVGLLEQVSADQVRMLRLAGPAAFTDWQVGSWWPTGSAAGRTPPAG